MLYLHYCEKQYAPILLKGSNLIGKSDINKIVEKQFRSQYCSSVKYSKLKNDKNILLIDDIDSYKTNTTNFLRFISSIKDYFDSVIIFIDKLSNLSDRSAEHDYFLDFAKYTICKFGHKKRDELIKKCISHDENLQFDMSNIEQIARLDRDTKHINTIIGSNIVPSYPIFIVTIFHTVESAAKHDLSQTSYGHCYHSMIIMNLTRLGLKSEDVKACINFLTKLAYFMFNRGVKFLNKKEMKAFEVEYSNKYVILENINDKLISANIIRDNNGVFDFQYVYIYYYFVARYIAENISERSIKTQISKLLLNIHLKDNANIIIFITHHTNNKELLEEIMINALVTFDKYQEATLAGEGKNLIKDLSNNIRLRNLPNSSHDIGVEREKHLNRIDKMEKSEVATATRERQEDNNEDPLLIDIRKSAKSMEIIGQILKNQYGTLEKDMLKELFETGQNVGLRLLKSFISLIINDGEQLEQSIEYMIEQTFKVKGKKLTNDEKNKLSQKFIAQFSYSVVFGWLYKIVDSLGYYKIVEIADEVNSKTNTVASKLINLSIHTWDKKKLDLKKLEALYDELNRDKNFLAIYYLKDIISRHIYMHKINYHDKQIINNLLGFSLKKQVFVQKQLA